MNRIPIRLAMCLAILAGIVAACGKSGEDEPYVTDAGITPRSTSLGPTDSGVFVSVSCSGDWTIALEYNGMQNDWAMIEPDSGTGNKADVRFRCSANDSADPREVTLVLRPHNGLSASVTIYQLGVTQVPPVVNPTGGHYGSDVSKAGWLELPTTVTDGRDMFTFDLKGNKYYSNGISGTRNYSCDWDYSEHMSAWVAYPLNADLYGTGKYSYNWTFVPEDVLPKALQPDITQRSYGGKGFDGSNWARGHQMARADRQISQDAVTSTCTPLNATPQDQSFNSGIWVNLENDVRAWAPKVRYDSVNKTNWIDTLYVVTGCVWKNSQAQTSANSGFVINVPSAYYKALLYAYKDSSTSPLKYSSVAFYLPHDASIAKGDYQKYKISVRELEDKTGIEFFCNLSNIVGKDEAVKIKAVAGSYFTK